MDSGLSGRNVSGFPLSIGTALSFESLFPPRQSVHDQDRPVPDKIVLASYSQLWVNVDTLFRNMIGACTKDTIDKLGFIEVARELDEEMETIRSLLQVEGKGRTTPVFYLCNYSKALKDRSKVIDIRTDSTPAQIYIRTLRDKTMEWLVKNTENVRSFSGAIEGPGTPVSALILTHYPYDLLSRSKFTKLDLLESNTGKLKTPQQWNSKYYPLPKKDMSILPWYRMLLMTFGDKVLIIPQAMKLRNEIYSCAEKRQWTPGTTMDKCLLDLSLDLHPYDFDTIRNF